MDIRNVARDKVDLISMTVEDGYDDGKFGKYVIPWPGTMTRHKTIETPQMNEEELIEVFEKGLNTINEKLVDKLNGIPMYGPILYVFVSSLVDALGSFVEGDFDEVYRDKLDALHVPITGATVRRVVKFYNHFPSLAQAYAVELADITSVANLSRLRKHYEPLFKVLVLKDFFMTVAYAEEVKQERWADLADDYFRRDGEPSKLQALLNAKEPIITGDTASFLSVLDFLKEFANELTDEFKNNKEFKTRLAKITKDVLGPAIPGGLLV